MISYHKLLLNNKMKQRISIAIDEETLKLIEESLKSRQFRNRSHAIEFLVNEMLKIEKEAKRK